MLYEYRALCTRVTDGDTLRLDIDLGFNFWFRDQPVRLYGVNCPETGTAEGVAARGYVTAYMGVLPRPLVVQTLKDATEKYGRWLVRVRRASDAAHSIDLNRLLLRDGHAVEYLP